jgi:hypothetical protein
LVAFRGWDSYPSDIIEEVVRLAGKQGEPAAPFGYKQVGEALTWVRNQMRSVPATGEGKPEDCQLRIVGYSLGANAAQDLAWKLVKERVVHHLVYLDYNWGACRFSGSMRQGWPGQRANYQGAGVPPSVAVTTHVMSMGPLDPRVSAAPKYTPKFSGAGGPLPAPTTVVQHTANVWNSDLLSRLPIWSALGDSLRSAYGEIGLADTSGYESEQRTDTSGAAFLSGINWHHAYSKGDHLSLGTDKAFAWNVYEHIIRQREIL